MRKTLCYLACALLLLAGCAPAQPAAEPQAPPAVEEPEVAVPYADTVAAVTPEKGADIARQREKYPDTVGWLTGPGTTIDSAVVQGNDITNEYYLNHDLDGNPDKDGTYSVHYFCKMHEGTREGMSRNTALFAHNHNEDPDGILFAQLKKFKDPAFAEQHPYIFFSATEEDMAWEVFAVYDTTRQFDYIESDPSWWEMQRIVELAQEASIYDYGIEVTKDDKVLTLSTCSFDIPGVGLLPITTPNDYRFVVMARLVAPDEARREQASFTVKEEFLLPDAFPTGPDMLALDGTVYFLSNRIYEHPCILPPDRAQLVRRGEVLRTAEVSYESFTEEGEWLGFEEGSASFLPVGTELLHNPRHPMTILVDMHGELLPYTTWVENGDAENRRLLLQENGETVHDVELTDELDESLWSIFDMADAEYLGDEVAEPSGDTQVILQLDFPQYRIHFAYYVGVPESVGEARLFARIYDGNYCKDAALFGDIIKAIEENSTQE